MNSYVEHPYNTCMWLPAKLFCKIGHLNLNIANNFYCNACQVNVFIVNIITYQDMMQKHSCFAGFMCVPISSFTHVPCQISKISLLWIPKHVNLFSKRCTVQYVDLCTFIIRYLYWNHMLGFSFLSQDIFLLTSLAPRIRNYPILFHLALLHSFHYFSTSSDTTYTTCQFPALVLCSDPCTDSSYHLITQLSLLHNWQVDVFIV